MYHLLLLLLSCLTAGSSQAHVYPIQFSIAAEKIVKEIPEKTKDFALMVPGDSSTFVFWEEGPYYAEYQRSYFGLTCKKGGWDCQRHYEILANGCIPYFTDLDKCNPNTMSFFPKQLVWEAMHLPGVSYRHIDHSLFDKAKYYEILNKLLEYTRTYLTHRAMVQYMFSVLNYQGNGHILYLSQDPLPDHQRDFILLGLKDIFGANVVDYPKLGFLYNTYTADTRQLFARGFTFTKLLDDPFVDRSNIEQRIKNKEFDLIIYGSVHRGLPFHDIVRKTYPEHKIVYVCGEDAHHCPYTGVKNLFLREFDSLR